MVKFVEKLIKEGKHIAAAMFCMDHNVSYRVYSRLCTKYGVEKPMVF